MRAGNMVQEKQFVPEEQMQSSVMKGITSLPPLHGFVLTTPKSRAETILQVPPDKDSEGDTDPVLAKWRFGLGTTAAFTSDLGTKWGKDWLGWDHYRPFLKQLMIDHGLVDLLRAKHPDEPHYTWWDYREGGFRKNKGLRIDHMLVTADLVERCTSIVVDRDAREGKLPSDHAPVIATFR